VANDISCSFSLISKYCFFVASFEFSKVIITVGGKWQSIYVFFSICLVSQLPFQTPVRTVSPPLASCYSHAFESCMTRTRSFLR
jgi:hypothetical protein